MARKKRIVFLSGTRAEFGKLKPLIRAMRKNPAYEPHLFITGMHMLEKYGSTAHEILKEFSNVYMYNNQAFGTRMDVILGNTVYGFGHYVSEAKPDLLMVHGDRVEALAGAIVGSFNNILVAHIEGGELSGTIDELIRHSITKLSHLHFVSNKEAKNRLIQMGERVDSIYVTGSPDIDVMFSKDLPSLKDVRRNYKIDFKKYAILIYHPVTTEADKMACNVKEVVDAVIQSGLNYIVIYPNNDPGSDIIFKEYERFKGNKHFLVFPSIRFERFLVLLKNCQFIIGNSSVGIREAPRYGVPTINIGSRQSNRFHYKSIFNVAKKSAEIKSHIRSIVAHSPTFPVSYFFGNGNSAETIMKILQNKRIWKISPQKQFVDIHHIISGSAGDVQ